MHRFRSFEGFYPQSSSLFHEEGPRSNVRPRRPQFFQRNWFISFASSTGNPSGNLHIDFCIEYFCYLNAARFEKFILSATFEKNFFENVRKILPEFSSVKPFRIFDFCLWDLFLFCEKNWDGRVTSADSSRFEWLSAADSSICIWYRNRKFRKLQRFQKEISKLF